MKIELGFLDSLVAAEKVLPSSPQWIRSGGREYSDLVSSVDLDAVSIEGVRFGAKSHLSRPDGYVSFRLDVLDRLGTGKFQPILRFDWKPVSPHSNKGLGPADLRFREITGSHTHHYRDNIKPDGSIRVDLPVAWPVRAELATYEEALEFCESFFRIKDLRALPVPPWSTRLI